MGKKKILIVDDDRDFLRALNIRLKANNYETAFASDGYAATKAVKDEKPDLVILDLGLPMGDGFIVMDRIKDFMLHSLTPIIVLSGRDPMANEKRALKAGAFAYFQKPADNEALLACIRKALEQVD
jgi:two-component system KDP operon response regulator KdpE